MELESWERMRLSPGEEDLVWELFHENSKTDKFNLPKSSQAIVEAMQEMYESLPYDGYPKIKLPELVSLKSAFEDVLATRSTARSLRPSVLTLAQLGTLLHHSYGVTRDNSGTNFPRSFRVVPSGGALYPLEIFFHSMHVQGLSPGLYHYNPVNNFLSLLQEKDQTAKLSEALVQKSLAYDTSLILFITAIFDRSTFKYGDRGYRFSLLEAGHVAQNISLVANALGLGCINIGGFYDRQIDELLNLDGLTHSTIYLAGIGKTATDANVTNEWE